MTIHNVREMQILNPSGHLTVAWNTNNQAEVDAARATFDEMTGKGYTAFELGEGGAKGQKLKRFDPGAEEIILVPPIRGG
jgi:hypothetical protein